MPSATVSADSGQTGGLAEKIAESLRSAGKDLSALKTADLASVDEFHFRDGSRKATLELAAQSQLSIWSALRSKTGLKGPV